VAGMKKKYDKQQKSLIFFEIQADVSIEADVKNMFDFAIKTLAD